MLRLVYCKYPSVRYCWSRTQGIDIRFEVAFFHLITQRLDVGLVFKRFYPVLLLLSIGQTKSYVTYLGLTVLGAIKVVNTTLDLFCVLLTLTSESYRAYTAIRNIRNSSDPLPIPMTGKRRRGSEGDVGIGRLRREEIDETIRREQTKRKWVDDLDVPPIDCSIKKPRFWSFHLADIEWSRGKRRAARKKASSCRRYMYRWVPRRPPWYTLRVYKRYAPVGNPRRTRPRYSKRQIQGLENFLSKYDPPLNTFCLDDLKDSLPSLSPPGTADSSAKIHSAPPMHESK